jgi:hypothetical protein
MFMEDTAASQTQSFVKMQKTKCKMYSFKNQNVDNNQSEKITKFMIWSTTLRINIEGEKLW